LLKNMKVAFRILNKDAAKIPNPYEPWTAGNARQFDRLSLASRIRQLPVSLLCMLALDELLESDNGVPTVSQSYLGVLAMIKGGGLWRYWNDTETHRCSGGNSRLADELYKRPVRGDIKRGCRVKAIRIGKRGVKVELASGPPLEGDYLILAVPPSMWSKITFYPPLPKSPQPQMGQNVKFLMGFRRPFWKTNDKGPEFASDGPINLTWESTANQAGSSNLNAIAAFSGGEDAQTCRDWKSSERLEHYTHELSRAYKGVRSSLLKYKFEDWPSNEWVCASYAFPQPGEIMKWGKFMNKGRGRLHFAGEHTCYAFIGYMEGALQSGLRVAERIARRDGIIGD
jgi:monoamine oxidase